MYQLKMYQYEMFEISLEGEAPTGSHVHVEVEAEFTLCGETTKVKGFYAGNDTYKVRFYPAKTGTGTFRVTGAVQAEGTAEVLPAREGIHGRVRVEGTHFVYEDGSPYYPFGTTVYALLHQEPELMEQTFASLEKAPFNKIRICVFPKHYLYNENEPLWYAFEGDSETGWDTEHPCFPFWDALEAAVDRLNSMQIQVDLILFHPYDRWGFSKMGSQSDRTYLEYLLRRLSAIPNLWWSMANEYDLCDRSMEEWYGIEKYLTENDPYHHLLSNHNCFRFWDFERERITHASIQSKMLTRINEWRQQYHKPVVIDECCYEGDLKAPWGCISGKEMVRRFWRTVATGGYCTHGETYLDPEGDVLWWSKGGKLKGESPARIAFLREILESLPGPLEAIPAFPECMREIIRKNGEDEKGWEEFLGKYPPEMKNLAKGFGRLGEEMDAYVACEAVFQGHCKEEAYLIYYDLRCCREDEIELPETRTYRLELIDTWNMTKTVIGEGVKGKTRIALPGREDYAVLAVEERP